MEVITTQTKESLEEVTTQIQMKESMELITNQTKISMEVNMTMIPIIMVITTQRVLEKGKVSEETGIAPYDLIATSLGSCAAILVSLNNVI